MLPGLLYRLPPPQDKLSMLACSEEEGAQADRCVAARYGAIEGLCLPFCRACRRSLREVQNSVGRGGELFIRSMTPEQRERTQYFVKRLIQTVRETSGKPHMVSVCRGSRRISRFSTSTSTVPRWSSCERRSFSGLLDDFYAERDQMERMRVKKSGSPAAADEPRRPPEPQDRESDGGARGVRAQRETHRVMGDLISANMYAIKKAQKRFGCKISTMKISASSKSRWTRR